MQRTLGLPHAEDFLLSSSQGLWTSPTQTTFYLPCPRRTSTCPIPRAFTNVAPPRRRSVIWLRPKASLKYLTRRPPNYLPRGRFSKSPHASTTDVSFAVQRSSITKERKTFDTRTHYDFGHRIPRGVVLCLALLGSPKLV